MQITQDSFGGRNVVFDYVYEDLPGGCNLDKSRLKAGTTYLKAGTLVNLNKSTRIAEIVKTATVITGGSSTAVRVPITHQFKAGEYVTDGVAVQTISTITAGTTYDTLNLGGALLAYGAGVVIAEVNASASMIPVASVTLVTGSGKSLTVTDPSGKLAGVNVAVTANGSDALAVTFANNTLSIALASTTAASNTPGVEIQAAIRALTTAGYAFLNVQCSGDEIAGSALTPASGTIATNQPYKYLPSGFIKDKVNVEYDNVDISVVLSGAVRESALPFPLTTAMKTQLPKVTFN